MQLVPHVPHAPPLQKLVHVWPDCHAVQPIASATQVCTVVPAQRVAPAVHIELQLPHEPFMHCEPEGHARALQLVQPVSTSQSQVSTPVAVQRELPMAHC